MAKSCKTCEIVECGECYYSNNIISSFTKAIAKIIARGCPFYKKKE